MVWAVSLSTLELSSQGLTPGVHLSSIRSLVRFGRLVGPLAYSVTLPLAGNLSEASPRTISRRTSYCQV